ncbi:MULTISPECIES: gamma-mobile-trio recombinase GmtY [Pseudomonas]|jgi:integrase|uniref:gamma-mobile-trio recombinase GmtY n=1 Tax=Pseudomonas TaxID=286 RepID=UPI001E5222A5|nr:MULTISPECIES: gamma-mobile-trio recombinase GmtY [Pseudomonas]EKT4492901.1 site-specific integrase [Pseudomonas putida]EKT8865190.1 site-specific integrase [Pseudomonas putida]MCE0905002.1 site-specific integrase [Pseudomonas alloputida]
MPVVEAYAKVVVDDSGFRSEIPVLLAEQGVVTPLLNYLLNKQTERSLSWQRNVVTATKLLLQYMEANQRFYSDPATLFQSFASHLFTGTVGDDGLDPSGLYWIPASTSMANRHISALKGLTDYLADHEGVQHMVPLVTANSYDQRLSYAAWYRRNQNDFLGHIKDKTVNDTIQKARNIKGRRTLSKIDIDADAFPESLFERFFIEGIGGALDRRCAVRDQLIMIMMHGAGLRESEPLHLWVQDVQHDPHDLEKALVRVYHPEDGRAPDDWKSQTGKTNRSAYLRENYALPPRNKLRGTKIVGWKVRMHDHPDYYVQMHWFPSDYGRLFLKLWREHLFYLVNTERHHPYAFISYEQDSLGQPYTLNAFNKNYAAAMARIGLSASKIDGLSPHGHRHAYGRRLASAGVDPIIRKKALHHSSLESQIVYTAPGILEVTHVLSQASERLAEHSGVDRQIQSFTNWGELVKTGFEDIDPLGLLSGPHCKIRKD